MAAPPRAPAATNWRRVHTSGFSGKSICISSRPDLLPETAQRFHDVSLAVSDLPVSYWVATTGLVCAPSHVRTWPPQLQIAARIALHNRPILHRTEIGP